MNTRIRLTFATAGAMLAGAGLAAPAHGDAIYDFAFNSLSSSYDAESGDLRSTAVHEDTLSTSGNVRRLEAPADTARYNEGFADDILSDAAVVLEMKIADSESDERSGAGMLMITDDDGDTLSADLVGTWTTNGLGMFFNGLLTDVRFADNGDQDGLFEGPDGGDFMFDPDEGPYEGALVLLQLDTAGTGFEDSFEAVATDVMGQAIPAPGGLALAAIGLGACATGRRRRDRIRA